MTPDAEDWCEVHECWNWNCPRPIRIMAIEADLPTYPEAHS